MSRSYQFKQEAKLRHINKSITFVSDSIEANVDSASSHVEQGNVQLEKARDYQVIELNEYTFLTKWPRFEFFKSLYSFYFISFHLIIFIHKCQLRLDLYVA